MYWTCLTVFMSINETSQIIMNAAKQDDAICHSSMQ